MSQGARTQAITILLAKLDSIAVLSDIERQAIQTLPTDIRMLAAGQDIVCDGDTPSYCCLIVEGWAYRYKLIGEGRRQILSFHVPGDLPDLQSLHIRTMDHSLAALTNATLAFISHESIRELTWSLPGLAEILWRETLVDAATFREWIVGLGRRSAYENMAHLFCELYLKLQAVGLAGEHRCPLPMTQGDLSDAMGLSNVHVNRVLQEMRAKGLITLRNNTLVIEAWDELIRVAAFDPTYLHLRKAANR